MRPKPRPKVRSPVGRTVALTEVPGSSARTELTQYGLRVTQPRLLVLAALGTGTERSHSVETLHSRLRDCAKDLSIATLYRVLADFEKVGLLARQLLDGGRVLVSLRTASPFGSLICVACGLIQEFTDEEIDRRQIRVGTQSRFAIHHCVLRVYGYCSGCQSHPNRTARKSADSSQLTERLRGAQLLTVRRRLGLHFR
jgi:Fur family transcriptional regulator, ferric uptake regulator